MALPCTVDGHREARPARRRALGLRLDRVGLVPGGAKRDLPTVLGRHRHGRPRKELLRSARRRVEVDLDDGIGEAVGEHAGIRQGAELHPHGQVRVARQRHRLQVEVGRVGVHGCGGRRQRAVADRVAGGILQVQRCNGEHEEVDHGRRPAFRVAARSRASSTSQAANRSLSCCATGPMPSSGRWSTSTPISPNRPSEASTTAAPSAR